MSGCRTRRSPTPFDPWSGRVGSRTMSPSAVGRRSGACCRSWDGRRRAAGHGEDGSPGRLHGAFVQLVEELGRERPVVVIVEDLHWSDASTRNLLMYAMRACPRRSAAAGRHVSQRRHHPAPPAASVPRRGGAAGVHRHRRARPPRRRRCRAAAWPRLLGSRASARHGGRRLRALWREPLPRRGGDRRRHRPPRRAAAATTAGHPARADHLAVVAGGRGAAHRSRRWAADRRWTAAPRLPPWRPTRSTPRCESCSTTTSSNRTPIDRGYVFRHALTAEAVYDDTLPGERVRLHTAFASRHRRRSPTGHRRRSPSLRSSAPGTGNGPATAPRHFLRGWRPPRKPSVCTRYPEALAAYENALELWPSIDDAETLAGLDEVELLRRAAEAANRAPGSATAH